MTSEAMNPGGATNPGDMNPGRLPWHDAEWKRLQQLRAQNRLPHALLLRGPAGVGKQQFATSLACDLLCEAGAPTACGTCKPCRLLAAGSHPDYYVVELLEDKKSIGIDQIRELIQQLALTPKIGTRKVGVIQPAERMTLAAANSLLKTLEEPPGDVVLMLVSGLGGALPITIRSRCQLVRFPAVDEASALQWLQHRLDLGVDAAALLAATRGRPFAALALAGQGGLERKREFLNGLQALTSGQTTPLEAAESWLKLGAETALDELITVVIELSRHQTRISPPDSGHRADGNFLQAMADQLDLQELFSFYDKCLELRRLLTTHSGLNAQLQLEDLALCWHDALRPAAARAPAT